MSKEPLVTTAVVTSILGAILALLSSFGVPLTHEQQAAISGLALVVAPLIVALVVRPKVTPTPAVAKDAGLIDNGWLGTLVLVLLAIALLIWIITQINIH